jgi:hypothetical protein
MSPTHKTKISANPLSSCADGIFGAAIAFAGVNEMQTRGSAHLHLLLITDISSLWIQTYLDSPECMERFSKRLDSMVRAYLPADAPIVKETFSAKPTAEKPTPMYRDHRIQPDASDPASIELMGTSVAAWSNDHEHTHTCHKKPSGDRHCRLGMPKGCHNGRTGCLQIELFKDPVTGRTYPRALTEIEPRKDTSGGDPLLKGLDSRKIVMELYRPGTITEEEPERVSENPRCVMSMMIDG